MTCVPIEELPASKVTFDVKEVFVLGTAIAVEIVKRHRSIRRVVMNFFKVVHQPNYIVNRNMS